MFVRMLFLRGLAYTVGLLEFFAHEHDTAVDLVELFFLEFGWLCVLGGFVFLGGLIFLGCVGCWCAHCFVFLWFGVVLNVSGGLPLYLVNV